MNTKNDFNGYFNCKSQGTFPRTISDSEYGWYHSTSEAVFCKFFRTENAINKTTTNVYGSRERNSGFIRDEWDLILGKGAKNNRYTPDAWLVYKDQATDKLVADIIDIKARGYNEDQDQQRITKDLLITGCFTTPMKGEVRKGLSSDKEFNCSIRKICYISSSGITAVDATGKPTQASIYKCPKCGSIEIKTSREQHTCTKCGSLLPNSIYTTPAEILTRYHDEDRVNIHIAEYTAACEMFEEVASGIGLTLTPVIPLHEKDKRNFVHLLDPRGNNRLITPDYCYTAQDKGMPSFENVPEQQGIIFILPESIYRPTKADGTLKTIKKITANKQTPIHSAIFWCPDGLWCTESGRGEKLKAACFYDHTCSDGQHFAWAGSTEDDTCPRCGGHCHQITPAGRQLPLSLTAAEVIKMANEAKRKWNN